MKKSSGSPLPALVAGIVIVAAVATVIVDGGWVLWVPALAALGVTAWLSNALGR